MHNLNKAKKNHGIVPVRFLNIVVAGIGAVGKTNFIHLLMKKRFNQDHHSSNILCINHLVSFQMPSDKVTWVSLDSELIAGYLRSMLLPQMSPKQVSTVSSNEAAEKKVTVLPDSTELPTKPQSKPPKQQSSVLNWFTGLFGSSIKDSNLSIVDSIINSKPTESGTPVYQPGGVLNIITLLDTGGQPEYIHLLPTINVNSKVTFVVHNLSKSLDDQVLVEYSQHGKHVFTPYHLSYSNLDMIKFLMSNIIESVQSPAYSISHPHLVVIPGGDDKSYICIVGTHADIISQSDKENTNKKILSLVNEMKSHALVWYQKNNSVLFSVDNTTAGERYEDSVATDIRNRIEEVTSNQEIYELPISWVLLQLEIRQVCSQKCKSYISFSDCVTIAKESGLISNIAEVKSVL